jgi:serine/threonine protein kinase
MPAHQTFSVLVVGKLKSTGQPVIAKMFYTYPKTSGSTYSVKFQRGLMIEQGVYAKKISKMDRDGVAVNFIKGVANASYPITDALRLLKAKTNGRDVITALDRQVRRMRSKSGETVAPNMLHMTIMEHIEHNKDLEHYIKYNKRRLTPYDIKVILFQILHAIWVCQKYGLQHNDLHDHNILFQLAPKERAIQYSVGGKKYRVDFTRMTSPAKVLLFDWDNSTTDGKTPELINTALSCKTDGMCADIEDRFDSYTILNYIADVLYDNSTYASFYRKAVPKRYNQLFDFRLCVPDRDNYCGSKIYNKVNGLPMDRTQAKNRRDMQSIYPTPYELLKDPFFDDLRT